LSPLVFLLTVQSQRDHIPTDKIVRLQFHIKRAESKINLFYWTSILKVNILNNLLEVHVTLIQKSFQYKRKDIFY